MAEPFTMRWHDDELLPDDVRNMLCGPGAPFELVEEDVLGETLRVFAQRPRNMREVLLSAAEKHGDSPYLVFGDETVTYKELPGRVASYAAVLAEEYGVGKGDRVAIAEREHRRVRAHHLGLHRDGRGRHRLERLVDRSRAGVRRGAHPAEGADR